jgi:hypothetical protein
MGVHGIVISVERVAASADAISPGSEITVGPFSRSAVRIAVLKTVRLLRIDDAARYREMQSRRTCKD